MAKITPKSVLNFNRKAKDKKVEDKPRITADNIMEYASSDNVSDAMKNLYKKDGLIRGVKAVNPKHKVAGFIKTVETDSYDWGTGIKGIYACDDGEILFIKCSDNDYAVWGGLASASAREFGVKATVLVGSSRDTEDILELDYPVYSQVIQSRAGLPLNEGSVGEDLIVEESVVKSGDFIVCDCDGVVLVPQENLEEVLEEVNNIKEFENNCARELLDNHRHLDEIIGF